MSEEAKVDMGVKAEPMNPRDITAKLFGDKIKEEEVDVVEKAAPEAPEEAGKAPVEVEKDTEPTVDTSDADMDVNALLDSMGIEEDKSEEPVENDAEDELLDGVDQETVESMNEKQARAFKIYREKEKALQRELRELKANAKPSEEVEQWKKKFEEVDSELQKENFVKSNYFKKKHQEPIKQKALEINSLGKELGVKPEVLAAAGRLPTLGAQLQYLEKNIPSATAKTLLATEFTALNRMAKEAGKAVEDWKTNKQVADAEDSNALNKQVEHLQETFVENAVKELSDSGSLLMKNMKNETWTKLRNERIERARDLIKSGDVAKQTQAVLKGSYADELEKMFLLERKRREKLEKDMAKFKKASPSLGNSDTHGRTTKKEVDINNIGQTVIDNLLNKRNR